MIVKAVRRFGNKDSAVESGTTPTTNKFIIGSQKGNF